MGLFNHPDVGQKRTSDTDWQTEMHYAEQAMNDAGQAKREGRFADAADLESLARIRLDDAERARNGR